MKAILSVCIAVAVQSCNLFVKPQTATFEATPQKFEVKAGVADEASGMVPSRSFANHLWVHEDGNNASNLYLLTDKGEWKGQLTLPVPNRDWEDMAAGPGPVDGKNYLYIGEIGDNNAVYGEYAIHRLPEPSDLNARPVVETIRFKYPQMNHDAETLLLDPQTKDIYIVTKRLLSERIYRLPYPQSTTEVMTAQLIGTTTKFMITGGDVSADGSEILLRTYNGLFYYKKGAKESVGQALMRAEDLKLPYTTEPQGEAICFDMNSKGYFTISERVNEPVYLYYYGRK